MKENIGIYLHGEKERRDKNIEINMVEVKEELRKQEFLFYTTVRRTQRLIKKNTYLDIKFIKLCQNINLLVLEIQLSMKMVLGVYQPRSIIVSRKRKVFEKLFVIYEHFPYLLNIICLCPIHISTAHYILQSSLDK